jgi:tryptophan-rich sensory protein
MDNFEDKVLREIERRNLKPRPFLYFLGRRSVFWTLAAVSLILGSIAAATSLFLALDQYYNSGRELDEMPFDNIAAFAPFIWLGLFAVFGVSAQRSFAATRDGYRYRPSRVIAFAFALSAAFGALLYTLDAGGAAHRFLGTRYRAYAEYTTIPYDHWSRPDEGFLGGEALRESPNEITIRDFHGVEWTIDISAAQSMLEKPAMEEGDIAVRGHVTGDHKFKATVVVPFD